MEKIDAYLSKQWNRWFAAKIIIFFSKIAGTFMFLYALGMGGYYENGGNLTAGETIGVIACVILLVIIVQIFQEGGLALARKFDKRLR